METAHPTAVREVSGRARGAIKVIKRCQNVTKFIERFKVNQYILMGWSFSYLSQLCQGGDVIITRRLLVCLLKAILIRSAWMFHQRCSLSVNKEVSALHFGSHRPVWIRISECFEGFFSTARYGIGSYLSKPDRISVNTLYLWTRNSPINYASHLDPKFKLGLWSWQRFAISKYSCF